MTKLNPKKQKTLIAYAACIKNLDKKIKQLGAMSIFITQPIADAYKKADFVYARSISLLSEYYWMRHLNDTLMRTCLKVKTVCVDLQNELFFVGEDFYDSIHNTPSDAKKIREYLYTKPQSII